MTERAPDEDAPRRPRLVSRVGVVGLGLIGGSVARAARGDLQDVTLVGVDREVILDVARDQGIIDEGHPPEAAAEALKSCDLVLLCLPVRQVVKTLEDLGPALRDGPVVTDTGSTKVAVLKAAQAQGLRRFVGGHPMAGKPLSGLAHADPALFVGATWFVCPVDDPDAEATRLVRRFVTELGARAVELDAREHDRAVAVTSHLPHVLVNALAEAVLDEGVMEAAGGSLSQLLAVAGAPVETWGDTLATNREAVAEALREMAARLSDLAGRLDDEARIKDLFGRGRACRERILGSAPRPLYRPATPGRATTPPGPAGADEP